MTFLTKPATFSLWTRLVFEGVVEQTIPLIHELSDIKTDRGLEFQHVLLGKDVRDDLALPSMVGAIPSIEQTTVNEDKRTIKVRLEAAIAVCVYNLECIGVCDRKIQSRGLALPSAVTIM